MTSKPGNALSTLIIGFDSAWSERNRGAIVAVVRESDGAIREAGLPKLVNFDEAAQTIDEWKVHYQPDSTVVMIDQPIIVRNATGQRPVEQIASSSVGKRRGGMQPANTRKTALFGPAAPVFRFLERFGGPGNPLEPVEDMCVLETYPVLAIIALGWIVEDESTNGRLPKYNPKRKKTFSAADWHMLCTRAAEEFTSLGLAHMEQWLLELSSRRLPNKSDQDCLDACLCLLAGLYFCSGHRCLVVGDYETGYIVVPASDTLYAELRDRCERLGRTPHDWIRLLG